MVGATELSSYLKEKKVTMPISFIGSYASTTKESFRR